MLLFVAVRRYLQHIHRGPDDPHRIILQQEGTHSMDMKRSQIVGFSVSAMSSI